MITLYHVPQSRSSRIIWLLEELGVPYTICPVSIFRSTTGEGVADPENPHPDKRVPAIMHNGMLVAESVAIILYLTEAVPEARLGPQPGEAGRGDYLTWLAWYAAELEPILLGQMAGEVAGSTEKRRTYDLVLRRLKTALAQSRYLMGEVFTSADLLISSALFFGRQAFPESELLDAFITRCRTRPAALRALALDTASGIQKPA